MAQGVYRAFGLDDFAKRRPDLETVPGLMMGLIEEAKKMRRREEEEEKKKRRRREDDEKKK
jgi:hypothetical protein